MVEVYLATPLGKNSNIHAKTAAWCSYTHSLPEVIQWGYTNTLSCEMSRNTLIEDFDQIHTDCTHVLFVDSDVVPPKDCLKDLLVLDTDIAVAVCPIYMDGFFWSVKDENDQWFSMSKELPEEPFETSLAGAGCCLVRKEVFDEIEWPYFKMEYQPKYKNNGEPIKQDEGEYFFNKAKDKGYKIMVNPLVVCEHYNQVELVKTYNLLKDQIELGGVT